MVVFSPCFSLSPCRRRRKYSVVVRTGILVCVCTYISMYLYISISICMLSTVSIVGIRMFVCCSSLICVND
ncbi:hypothetical protein CSUI_010401 [Cystoisospora suis]|uniref:Transmembrane protein n=1 Tax=Cystoisospora suis TaxID=483139 RepID=A0A2C6JBL0_9APIC|nr:hypothetical protein CSUI_010401 [Cystoisospora suis]